MTNVAAFLKEKREKAAASGGTAGAAGGGASAGGPRKSVSIPTGRYAGMRSAEGRDAPLEPGKHRVRVLKTYETMNPKNGRWFHAQLEIVDSSVEGIEPGDKRWYGQCINDKSQSTGLPRVMAFVRAAVGFETDEDMFAAMSDVHEIDGEELAEWCILIDACHGSKVAAKIIGSDNPLHGRIVDVVTTAGKPPFVNNSWSPVPDEEQDSA